MTLSCGGQLIEVRESFVVAMTQTQTTQYTNYPTPLGAEKHSTHALFLKTLLPGGGIAVPAVTFFPTARTPMSFFFAAVTGAFLVFFTMVVPVEILDMLL